MPGFTLREAVPADAPHILSLIKSLALYERDPDAVTATEDLIRQNCFGKVANAVLAEVEGEAAPVGLALYFFNFSTWTGRPGLYLEDLFVKEEFRKLGIGKSLFGHLGKIAKDRGCARMEWVVLDWNKPAKDFYVHKLGAQHQSQWEIMRLEGPTLDRLRDLA